METLLLEASKRTETKKQLEALRKKGFIPAVVYGPDAKSQNLKVNDFNFQKVFKKSGRSTLVDLKIDDDKPMKVLIHEMQVNPVSDQVLHIDFYKVKLTEKLVTEIKINFIGEPKAVKDLGGILVENLSKIEVKCLPQDLIPSIDVDISKLNTFDDFIRVKDLNLPAGIEVMQEPEVMVAKVAPPKIEEEVAVKVEEKEAVEKVEVLKAKGKEEEAPEGEAGTEKAAKGKAPKEKK